LVQAVRGLSDGSGLTVTIAKYLTPKGTDIHKNGIEPDVKSEMTEKQLKDFTIEKLGTNQDSQYVEAQKILTKKLKLN
jgi:carboxyl-terminal processing protease